MIQIRLSLRSLCLLSVCSLQGLRLVRALVQVHDYRSRGLPQGNFILRIDRAQEKSIIDMLGAQVLQRLARRADKFVMAEDKTVLRRDPEFELVAVADHVESLVTNDRHQPDHAQHGWLSRQNIAANFLIVGDLAFLLSSYRGIDVYGGLHGLDLSRLRVDEID